MDNLFALVEVTAIWLRVQALAVGSPVRLFACSPVRLVRQLLGVPAPFFATRWPGFETISMKIVGQAPAAARSIAVVISSTWVAAANSGLGPVLQLKSQKSTPSGNAFRRSRFRYLRISCLMPSTTRGGLWGGFSRGNVFFMTLCRRRAPICLEEFSDRNTCCGTND
jgi:hypothetical protein